MPWDLRAALLKKGEIESARLNDFAFRVRARTMKLLAARLGGDEATVLQAVTQGDDQAVSGELRELFPSLSESEFTTHYAQCRTEAERQLLSELGDPTPHRLA